MTCPFLPKNSSKLLIAAPHPLGLGVFSSPTVQISHRATTARRAVGRRRAQRRPQQHNAGADASQPRKHGARCLPFKKFIVNDDNPPPKPPTFSLQIVTHARYAITQSLALFCRF